jgi:HK97 family phage portal protein
MLGNLFENRALSFQSVFASGDSFELQTKAGTVVNQNTAFQVSAIFSAVSLISSTVSTLPLDVYIRQGGDRRPFRPRPEWVLQPDVDTTRSAFYGAVIVSMLLEGNAFIRIYNNDQGLPVSFSVLNPNTVTIKRNGIGQVMFEVEGEERAFTSDEMIFIPDVVRPGQMRGVSRIEALKEDFSLAQALTNYSAKFFGSGTHTSGVIEVDGNLSAEQAKNLSDSFDARHRGWGKAHKTAVLSGGAKYTPTTTDPQQSQMIEAKDQSVATIARAFNIPPHLLGLDKGMSYASVEQNNLAWITHCLRPLATKIENGFSKLMSRYQGGERAFLKFNMDGLLRAQVTDRTQAYSRGLQAGYLTINDVRRLEDLPSVEDPSADTVRVPLANVNVENATVKSQSEKVKMARDLVMVGYDPEQVLEAFGLPAVDHTGLPSVQLQGVQNIDPENPESVYPDDEETDANS